ncbi:MAG: thioredoxin family protein [Ramlibacter sp.]
MNPSPDSANWWVICLCAEWCGVCRDWRSTFTQAALTHTGMRFAWIDIEDEADAMGDVDIETFPTLLVAQGGKARFYGPVQPSSSQLARLLASLTDGASAAATAQSQALLDRLAPIALSQS